MANKWYKECVGKGGEVRMSNVVVGVMFVLVIGFMIRLMVIAFCDGGLTQTQVFLKGIGVM